MTSLACDQLSLPSEQSPLTPSHILAFSQHTGQVSQGVQRAHSAGLSGSVGPHTQCSAGTAIPVAGSRKALCHVPGIGLSLTRYSSSQQLMKCRHCITLEFADVETR